MGTKFLIEVLVAIFIGLLTASKAVYPIPPDLTLTNLAKAAPDECFCGIGDPSNGPIDPDFPDCSNLTPASPPPFDETNSNCFCDDAICATNSCTLNQCVPKVSESYLWSLAIAGNKLWIGTFDNVICQGGAAFFGNLLGVQPATISTLGLKSIIPDNKDVVPLYTCEFGLSNYPRPEQPPDFFRDQRPPAIDTYDTQANVLERQSLAECKSFTPDFTAQDLLDRVIGLRSAGSVKIKDKYFIFFGGQSDKGYNVFAFKQRKDGTVACIGAKNFPEFSNARKWADLNGVLYVGVGNTDGGGSVLRWAPKSSNPLNFTLVGKTDTPVSNLAVHKEGETEYLAATTWPEFENIRDIQTVQKNIRNRISTLSGFAGLYISPPVGQSGLTESQADSWKKVWDISKYDPYIVASAVLGGGDLASLDGWLYWGTMHVPSTVFYVHVLNSEPDLIQLVSKCPSPPPQNPAPECQEFYTAQAKTDRSLAIFRGTNLGKPDQNIELLYGDAKLPVFFPDLGWVDLPNKTSGQNGIFGTSGFGKTTNKYAWTAKVFNNKLYFGTLNIALNGEVWRFNDNNSPAENVFNDGAGNLFNYGVRTMVTDDNCLYFGTANPFNLLTLLTDSLPEGGWELKKLCNAP